MMRRALRALAAVAGVVLVGWLIVRFVSPAPSTGAQGPTTIQASSRVIVVAAPGGAVTVSPQLVVANGTGWTTAGLEGTIPAPGRCHLRFTPAGDALPDPTCTPGAVDPGVTQDNLTTTVCRKGGYTASVRPPASLTTPAKKAIMAAYGIPWSAAADYELDHLVELGTGGASDIRNLWPEPNTLRTATASEYVHNDKDQVEQDAFTALCTGKRTLYVTQGLMSTDWTLLR